MTESTVHIIEYRTDLALFFKDLNVAWLSKYFTVEPIDEEMLSDPQKTIVDKGGHIFFAQIDNRIVGTFALMKVDDNIYELGKMAVDEKFQGKKIGNMLLEFCVNMAKELSIERLILFSNTMLNPAIHLYKKYGFVEVPLESSEYKRSNIKMEKLIL